MSPLAFDHVAVAVHAIADAAADLELLMGETCSHVVPVESQGVRVAFVGSVELLEPTGPDSTVARFLQRRGPGLHHIAFRTPDVRAEMQRLTGAGLQLIDPEPRRGAHGLVAFIHPRSTGGVLVELVQRDA
jgi:methylmalonyl-CoA epimerase